jgi:hypothetical protein
VIVALVPVIAFVSVAVTVVEVVGVLEVVNDTMASPSAFVVLVPEANEPPGSLFVHVTTSPAVWTGMPAASVSCAEIVTAAPAAGA